MKKVLILMFLISIMAFNVTAEDIPCLNGAGPLLLGQEYCEEEPTSIFNFLSDEHYRFNYASVYTHYFNVEQNPSEPLNIHVGFGFDLNNNNPSKADDKYRIVKNYDFYNFIRPSSSKTQIENFEDYGFSGIPEGDNIKDYDYIGAPLYLTSCYIDCNVADNTPAKVFNLDYNDILYLNFLESYDRNTFTPVSQQWYDNRYDDNELIVPYTLRFEESYYQCSYDEPGVKLVSMGCTIQKNKRIRHPNLESDSRFWDLDDIISDVFPSASDGKDSWTIQKRIEIDIDNKNYSTTVTTEDDGYIPGGESGTSGEGLTEESPKEIDLQKQKNIYLLKQNSEIENEWQTKLLSLTDIIFLLFMIIFYLISGFVLLFFFFGSMPYIFRKFNDNLEQLTNFKRRRK